MPTPLCPAQQKTLDQVTAVLPLFPVLGVAGQTGTGKSTILRRLHEQSGGEWISMRELLTAFRARHPLAMEEALHEVVESALKTNDHVYLDDFSLFTSVVQGCGSSYPRANLIEAVLQTITRLVEDTNKKLIVGSDYIPASLQNKGYVASIPPFEQETTHFSAGRISARRRATDSTIVEFIASPATLRRMT